MDEETLDIKTQEQAKNSNKVPHLQPWQYKKGQSGNPSGRPKGISLKEYARNKLLTMSDEEKEEFFNGLNKDTIWEMAEGKAMAESKMDVHGSLPINIIIKQDDSQSTSADVPSEPSRTV